MNADDPRHGTYAGAIAHWKRGESLCGPCEVVGRRESKARRLDLLRGQPRTVPLGEAAHRLLCTTSLNQIERATGIRTHRLIRYRDAGPSQTVHRTTRDRILKARGCWTAIGIQRRLQALQSLGWSMRTLATESDIDVDTLKRIRRRERLMFVRHEVAGAIVELYDRLHMTPGPAGRGATRVQREAVALGYAPPLAWDDIDRDERPKGLGNLAADRNDQIAELDAMGVGISEVCRRLDIKRDTLEAWCRRKGVSEVYMRLVGREAGMDRWAGGAA